MSAPHLNQAEFFNAIKQKAVVSAKAELRQEQTSSGRYHMGIADVSKSFIERSIVMHEKAEVEEVSEDNACR